MFNTSFKKRVIKCQLPCIDLPELVKKYGMPYYIKFDMDGVEKVFKQNAKQVQDTLTNYVKRRKTDDNWDEIVVDDFNIMIGF